jgi:putative ABC transport system permease protein
LGRRFRLGPDDAPLIEVVGVVGGVRGISLTDDPTLDVYLPYWQSDASLYSDRLSLVVRTSEEATAVVPTIRDIVHQMDPELPVPAFQSMDDIVEDSMAPRRLAMSLGALIALTAVLLACFGIYGILSYTVVQRTREIGVRMALGAQARDIRRLVFQQGFMPVTLGLICGLIGSLALSGILRGQLFGVRPTDPFTLAAVAAFVTVVAATSTYLPARQAIRVEPLIALRSET